MCSIEDLLPATIECRDNEDVEFVRAVCGNLNDKEFTLIPAYVFYMAARHYLLNGHGGAVYHMKRIVNMTSTAASNIYDTLQVCQSF